MDRISDAPRDFAGLATLLAERRLDLPRRLRQVADFALAHPDDVAFGTAATLAAEAGVQPSTLVRLAQVVGYAGFSEMQRLFRARLMEARPGHRARLDALRARGVGAGPHLDGFAEAAIASLERLRARSDPTRLEAAVGLLAAADTIVLVAARRLFPVTAYLAHAFAKMEIRCRLIDHVGLLGDERLACVGPNDAVIAVSFTPYTLETIDLVGAATRAGIPVVGITDSAFSPLVAAATLWLEVAEADYAAFRSLAATFALAATLAVAVAARRRGAED